MKKSIDPRSKRVSFSEDPKKSTVKVGPTKQWDYCGMFLYCIIHNIYMYIIYNIVYIYIHTHIWKQLNMFFGVLFSPTIPNLGCWGLKGPWWEVESWASIRSETAHWVRAPMGFEPWPPVTSPPVPQPFSNRVAPRTGSYGSVCEAFDTSKRCSGHPAEGIWQSDIRGKWS